MKIQDRNLIDLYKIYVEEEHYFLAEHQKRVSFYTGIITAIVTGLGVGLWKSTQWFHYTLIALGLFGLIVICELACKGCFRLYQRFLEAIIVRAKFEQYIGLTDKLYYDDQNDKYWDGESIIASRHIRSRLKYDTSERWQKAHNQKGYHLWTICLFYVIKWLSIALFFVCIFMSIKNI